jgi:mannan endo-1,4-beta-mannosidase
VNTVNGRRYADDATIMSWQLANEPRVGDCTAYTDWITETAQLIKSQTVY